MMQTRMCYLGRFALCLDACAFLATYMNPSLDVAFVMVGVIAS